jgi:hypothetical protein
MLTGLATGFATSGMLPPGFFVLQAIFGRR